MKRVIRSTTTGKFYNQGKWVNDPGQAQNFPALVEAIETVVQHRLKDVELIQDFGGKWEARFPWGISRPSAPAAPGASTPTELKRGQKRRFSTNHPHSA
jgi:hypothetical protein